MNADKPLGATVETSAARGSAPTLRAPRIQVGDRVRYKYADKQCGTVLRRAKRGGDWYVRWDTGYPAAAWEDNLEPEPPIESNP